MDGVEKAWESEHSGGLWNIALSEKDVARLASGVHPCLVQPEHLTAYWEYENMDKVEKVWQEFWKPIVAPDGKVDLEQVKKELYDFYMILDEVPRVYDAVTGGVISKPLTKADAVIAEFEYYTQKLVDEAVEDEWESGRQSMSDTQTKNKFRDMESRVVNAANDSDFRIEFRNPGGSWPYGWLYLYEDSNKRYAVFGDLRIQVSAKESLRLCEIAELCRAGIMPQLH